MNNLRPSARNNIKSASTQLALAGIINYVQTEEGHVKLAGWRAIGSAALKTIQGSGKLLGGKALMGTGKGLEGAGGFIEKWKTPLGAASGGLTGGMLGADENNSWGNTLANIGMGSAVGGVGGKFFGSPVAKGLRAGGRAITGNMAHLPGVGKTLAHTWQNEGHNILRGQEAIGKSLGPGRRGLAGVINRGMTPERVTDFAKYPAAVLSSQMGKGWAPYAAGGAAMTALTAPFTTMAAGREGGERAAMQMMQQYQNLPMFQRVMMGFNPQLMLQQLPPEMQQRYAQMMQQQQGQVS